MRVPAKQAWLGFAVTLLVPTLARAGAWDGKLAALEKALDRQQWKVVVDDAVELRGKMVAKSLKTFDPAALGRAYALEAIAEANLGRDRDAIWHWYSAMNFLPGIDSLELAGSGRAQGLLAGRSLAVMPPELSSLGQPPPNGEKLAAATPRLPVSPAYPKELIKAGTQGAVRIGLLVDSQGYPQRPRVLERGLAAGMAGPALDALASWRFEPAKTKQGPVAVEMTLEIRYP